jgi:hypothetical protein
MLDIPVSEEFDGKVLSSMFEPGFFRAHPPRTVETYEHIMPEKTTMPEQKLSEDVEKKLKGLGYLQ